jgi:hypothetical protein
MVGPALTQQAGGSGFCTTTCCTSADCPTGSVCFASGAGGSYCALPSWLGRAAPGGKIGGDSCSTGSDCRSGLCTNSTCTDTCCDFAAAGSECTGGRSCIFGAFPGLVSFDKHFAPLCAPVDGSGTLGASCSQWSDCQAGLCYTNTGGVGSPFCTVPCRGVNDVCGSGATCQYDKENNDIYFACFQLGPAQTTSFGSSCVDFVECDGEICSSNSSPNECTSVCVTDQDCRAPFPHCRPQSTPFLGTLPDVWITMCSP